MTRPMALVLGVALLAGCASYPHFAKGPDEAQYNRDHYACVMETKPGYAAGGTGTAGAAMVAGASIDARNQWIALYKLCMKARDYKEE